MMLDLPLEDLLRAVSTTAIASSNPALLRIMLSPPIDPRIPGGFPHDRGSTVPDQLSVVLRLTNLPSNAKRGRHFAQWQKTGIIPKYLSLILILIMQVRGKHEASVLLLSQRGPAPLSSALTIGGGGVGFRYFYNMHQTGPPPRLLARLRTVPYDRGGLLVFWGRWQPGSSFHSHPRPPLAPIGSLDVADPCASSAADLVRCRFPQGSERSFSWAPIKLF